MKQEILQGQKELSKQQLWILIDSAFPCGGFAHSQGLEVRKDDETTFLTCQIILIFLRCFIVVLPGWIM